MGLVFPFLTTSEMYEFLPEPVLLMAEFTRAEIHYLGRPVASEVFLIHHVSLSIRY